MLPSVQSVEKQENGADANDRAEDERVPSFTQVDSLDEIVDGGEPVSESQGLRSLFELCINRIANRIEENDLLLIFSSHRKTHNQQVKTEET